MIKNKTKQIEVKFEIREQGNWNFRSNVHPAVNTKPIAIIHLDGDEFVFRHDDILEIIKAYHIADKRSIEMIRDGKAGSVKIAELPLLDKIKNFIKDLKDLDNGITDSKFHSNGQKGLK